MLRHLALLTVPLIVQLAFVQATQAQVLDENFNTISQQGGGVFFSGAGFGQVAGWDLGIVGENAFAGTTGYARINGASAYGALVGVNESGAGVIQIPSVMYNLVAEPFDLVTGTGGGLFLLGDGSLDVFNIVTNWDDGLTGEEAYAGTYGGGYFDVGGGAYAEGLVGGGLVGGAGDIRIQGAHAAGGGWYGGLQWKLAGFPGAVRLANTGFDSGLSSWGLWGPGWNVLSVGDSGMPALSGSNVLKLFGQFTGAPNTSGVFQDLPAQVGQTWQIATSAAQVGGDSIVGSQNFVDLGIEFRDSGDNLLLDSFTVILDGSSPTDVWIPSTPLQLTAPAGTAVVRAVVRFNQPGQGLYEGGAGLVDNVRLKLVGGPSPVDLSTIALTAKVRGTTNGAGQTLGHYQLRLEDPEGNRLRFTATANGTWQSIGGPLNTAQEADFNGNPASGVFDFNAESMLAVLAFADEGATWGTGGTLAVDDLILSNDDSAGSAWYAGLFWNGLQLPAQTDNFALQAKVKGSIAGGHYTLRLEGVNQVLAGLDESFGTATGVCGAPDDCVLLNADDVTGGIVFGFSNDYDTGISGEGAYGGVTGDVELFPSSGITARCLTTGGPDGTGCAQVRVDDIAWGPGGNWYAGLDWQGQGLASDNLSQVVLTAKIRGLANSGGELGNYELRIEDAQGDRLYFPMTADGTWQTVGGPLSTALEGPSLGGGGNGVFDFDSPNYAVAVSFRNEVDTWFYGGILEVDDVYLTPAVTQYEVGRVAFHGTTDGTFQNVGGLLSEGESTFGDRGYDFEDGTGTGGGEFYAANGSGILGGYSWDDGIANEQAFAGVWGSGSMQAVVAEVCSGCGVNGGKAAKLAFTNAADGGSGGWWAGLNFINVRVDLSAGDGDNLAALAGRDFSAKIKGTIDPNMGQSYGAYTLRLEDAQTDFLAFTVTSDGTWQTVGGPLSTATRGQTPDGNGEFDYFQGSYSAVLVVEGGTGYGAWGSGGTLLIDDLHVTGINYSDAESFTVTLAFEDETSSWGNAGKLTIDDLYLGPAGPSVCLGDVNCDGHVTFADIDPFVARLGCPNSNPTACNAPTGCTWVNADVNEDGAVTFADIDPFVGTLGNVCP